MSAPAPNKELLQSVEKGTTLKKVDHPEESDSLKQARLLKNLEKPDLQANLRKSSRGSLSQKDDPALASAKLMKAIEKKTELKHVPETKGEGLTQAEKEAYLEDKRNSVTKK